MPSQNAIYSYSLVKLVYEILKLDVKMLGRGVMCKAEAFSIVFWGGGGAASSTS